VRSEVAIFTVSLFFGVVAVRVNINVATTAAERLVSGTQVNKFYAAEARTTTLKPGTAGVLSYG